jgi:hypothetical protein
VLTLPSGKLVLGLGDAVVVHDPITGQGCNSAAKACRVYLEAIVHRGDQPFSREWIEQTFEQYRDYARWVVSWTNSLLCPPPPHILKLLGTAGQRPPLASAIANGFDHPSALFPWWEDAQACEEQRPSPSSIPRVSGTLVYGEKMERTMREIVIDDRRLHSPFAN